MKGLAFYDKDFFVIKEDHELISESIRRIIMTNPGERLGNPFFGVGLKNILFDQIDEITIESIEKDIKEQIEAYEPRALLTTNEVNFDLDNNMINIKLGFKIANIGEQDSERFINLSFELEK